MGAAAAPAAAGLSLASTGAQLFGGYETSRGIKAGDEYRAAELERAAEYGNLKATQVNSQMTRNLAISLGKLDSIRAASHTNPFDPSNAAVRDFTEQIGTEQKNIKVTSLTQQAQQDEADAAYMRYAGSQALLAGDIGMVGTALGGAAGAVRGFGGGSFTGVSDTPDPTRLGTLY